jgi:putative Mg2+ transporter-C (MgtC) family protein
VLEPTEILIRLGAATVAGAALGLDRELEAKPIGIRTLSLVSLGAATICVAALNDPSWAGNPDARSRVVQGLIQGVMAGIGFLGAGLILQVPEERRVKFLTSAATVWVTAALGIACGLGQWVVVGVAIGLSLGVLVVLRPFDDWLQQRKTKMRARKIAQDAKTRPET